MHKLFMTGLVISFLGALPMGMLNVSAMQISVTDGYRPALVFSLGALAVEMVYVRLTLVAMGWFRRNRTLLKRMEYITIAIILALAASSFYAAMHPSLRVNPILSHSINRFWLGASMSAVNPLQIPFWLGWSTILSGRGILVREGNNYISYIAGIGTGTFIGLSIFIFGGKLLVEWLDAGQDTVHWVLGAIFLATAMVMGFRMYRQKDAISTLEQE